MHKTKQQLVEAIREALGIDLHRAGLLGTWEFSQMRKPCLVVLYQALVGGDGNAL